MISVSNLVLSSSDSPGPAVHGVDFTVEEGKSYTLVGPSGCGKTTTLRCVAGQERPNQGTVELGGVVVVSDGTFLPAHRRDIGMVFQGYATWPHTTVFENAAFPLRVRGRMRSVVIDEKVTTALALGLDGAERRMATQLSSGQQQRVASSSALRAGARDRAEPKVLLLDEEVLLLDEPLSNLDAKLRERMHSELSLLQRRLRITTLFVTHDRPVPRSVSDRVAIMSQGKIAQEGTPREIYDAPQSECAASVIGSVNLISGTILGTGQEGGVVARDAFGTLHGAGLEARIVSQQLQGRRPRPDRASSALLPRVAGGRASSR